MRRSAFRERFHPWRSTTVASRAGDRSAVLDENVSEDEELTQTRERILRDALARGPSEEAVVDRKRKHRGGGERRALGAVDANRPIAETAEPPSKQVKREIKAAREAGDKLGEGRALLRMAELKLKKYESMAPSTSENHTKASSYALKGASILLNSGNDAEVLEGIRLYTRARDLESAEDVRRSKYFLPYQDCSTPSRDRERIREDIRLFEKFTTIVASRGNQLGEISILERISKTYLHHKVVLKDFLFFDDLERIPTTDSEYVAFLSEEHAFAEKFLENCRSLDASAPPRTKYLAKALLWKATTAIKLSRATAVVSQKKAKQFLGQAKAALTDLEAMEADCDDGMVIQRLCMESESLLLSEDVGGALSTATRALNLGRAAGRTTHVVWASIAKARAHVRATEIDEAYHALRGALESAQAKLEDNAKLEIYHCVECLKLKLGIKIKMAALESQLDLQSQDHLLTEGMRQEKIAHLTQIVRNGKEIGDWERVTNFATILSEVAALEPNSWEYLLEMAEGHFRARTYPKVAVMCSEAAAMAAANKCPLGKAKALLFRALSRVAIFEYDLAENDLLSCIETVDPEISPQGGIKSEHKEMRRVKLKCLNLLSLIEGFVRKREAEGRDYQAAANEMRRAAPKPSEGRQRGAKLDQLRELPVLKDLDFGIPAGRQEEANALVRHMHTCAAAEGARPSPMVEGALRGLSLTKNGAIRVRAEGALGSSQLTDADARVLVNVVFGTELCRIWEFDGIILELPGNKLGNTTVKAICGKIQENPSMNVRLVGLDLSRNNLSAGCIGEMSRCEKIKSHLGFLLLGSNKRLLRDKGDVRALETLLAANPRMDFDARGTMLSKEEEERLVRFQEEQRGLHSHQEGEEEPSRRQPMAAFPLPPAAPPPQFGALARPQAPRPSHQGAGQLGSFDNSKITEIFRRRRAEKREKERARALVEDGREEDRASLPRGRRMVRETFTESEDAGVSGPSSSLSQTSSREDEEDFLRDDCSSLSSHSDASQDRTRVSRSDRKRKGAEDDWRVGLKKLKSKNVPPAPRTVPTIDLDPSPSLSHSSETGESVSCTSDSFCPKYKTQR